MTLLETISTCLAALSSITSISPTLPSEADIRSVRLDLGDDICTSAAYMLGEVDEKGQLRSNEPEGKAIGEMILARSLYLVASVP